MKEFIFKKFNDNKMIILYLFLIFPFFKPPYFEILNTVDKIYQICFIISSCIMYFLCFKKKHMPKITVITLLLSGFLVLSSFLNNVLNISTIKIAIELFTVTLLTSYGLKYNRKDFLNALIILLGIFITINFITILVFPKGMYKDPSTHMSASYFLGVDNGHIRFFICYWIAYYTKYYLNKKHSILGLIALILSIISIIICKSATTLVGTFIIALYFVLAKYIDKIKFINVITYSITYIVAYVGIIFFQVQKYFSFIIENVLKKDVTFTKRTKIWENFFKAIKNKPILGYGVLKTDDSLKTINAVSAHNQILQVYYQGGIFALLVFLVIIFLALKELHKHFNNKLAKTYTVLLFSLLIMGLAEAIAIRYFLFILTFCDSIGIIIDNKKLKN